MSIFTKHVPYDKNVYESRTVTSHEHRAPTDESVRLLREMEDKARDSVFATLRCESSGFSVSAIVFEDHMTQDFTVRAKFTLGDTPYDLGIEVPFHKIGMENPSDNLARAVIRLIAEKVAEQITITALKDSWSFRKNLVRKA